MKILLIEDDGYMAQLYGHLFGLEKFEVELAANGQLAIDKLKETDKLPDMIVLDLMMSPMNGFTFLEELNKDSRLKDIHTVVLTNMYDDEARVKAKALGVKDFFIKSEQNPKQFIEQIKELSKEAL